MREARSGSSLLLWTLLLATLLSCGACGRPDEAETLRPPLVRATTARAASEAALEMRGTLAPLGTVRQGFKAPGVVASVDVRVGDRVRRGRLLARIDDVDARESLVAATAALARARRDAERAVRLASAGAMAGAQREDARNALEGSEATWRQASDALGRTRLVSQVDGTVAERLAEPGETVAAGAPVVVVDTSGRLLARVGVAARDLGRVHLGAPAHLLLEDDGTRAMGRVTSVAASPSTADGLYAIEVTPDGPLSPTARAGGLVTIRMDGATDTNGVRLPLEAVVHRRDRDLVFVLGGGGVVAARPVTVGGSAGTELTVANGLAPGERVVAAGAFLLQDGMAVRVAE